MNTTILVSSHKSDMKQAIILPLHSNQRCIDNHEEREIPAMIMGKEAYLFCQMNDGEVNRPADFTSSLG